MIKVQVAINGKEITAKMEIPHTDGALLCHVECDGFSNMIDCCMVDQKALSPRGLTFTSRDECRDAATAKELKDG